MSQGNVEIVRESVARFARGDIDGLADLYAADAVTFAPEGWPEGGQFDGRDAVEAAVRAPPGGLEKPIHAHRARAGRR